MPHAGDNTIVALATARGVAALATIRMSGSDALSIADKCFPGVELARMVSHSLAVGIFSTTKGEEIDRVVVSIFLAPNTVTGENVVEISCHGGDYAPRRIIESLVAAGARPAEPGEFTKRGFLNGRMDLAQAEAVASLIHAGSMRAQQNSLAQLKGGYSGQLEALRQEMLDLCALIELELDFSEEDVEFAAPERLTLLFERSLTLLTDLIDSYRFGVLIRDGIRVVIGGRPNAGKSTLLNAFVGYDRAIVSDIPGTTRDEIEAEVEFDGLRVRFMDTAGLRDTENEIEAEGVRRAKESIRQADALLYIFDIRDGLNADERGFLSRVRIDRPDLVVILLANKVDLLGGSESPGNVEALDGCVAKGVDPSVDLGAEPVVDEGVDEIRWISAIAAQSDEQLVRSILKGLVTRVRGEKTFDEAAAIVTNERHRDHLKRAHDAVQKAADAWEIAASGDMLAFELREAMSELGAITGATTNEDVLGHIFSKFCIGK